MYLSGQPCIASPNRAGQSPQYSWCGIAGVTKAGEWAAVTAGTAVTWGVMVVAMVDTAAGAVMDTVTLGPITARTPTATVRTRTAVIPDMDTGPVMHTPPRAMDMAMEIPTRDTAIQVTLGIPVIRRESALAAGFGNPKCRLALYCQHAPDM